MMPKKAKNKTQDQTVNLCQIILAEANSIVDKGTKKTNPHAMRIIEVATELEIDFCRSASSNKGGEDKGDEGINIVAKLSGLAREDLMSIAVEAGMKEKKALKTDDADLVEYIVDAAKDDKDIEVLAKAVNVNLDVSLGDEVSVALENLSTPELLAFAEYFKLGSEKKLKKKSQEELIQMLEEEIGEAKLEFEEIAKEELKIALQFED